MNPDRREPRGEARDLSGEFFDLSESKFWDLLDELGSQPVVLEIPVSGLASDFFQNRLKRFLEQAKEGQNRKAIIQATKDEQRTFQSRFPGVEWKIVG